MGRKLEVALCVDMASMAMLGGVLLALTLLPSGLAGAPQMITQEALSQFSDMANKTIIMALQMIVGQAFRLL